MKREDKLMTKFVYYLRLQTILRNMNAMLFGIRQIFSRASAHIPKVATHHDPSLPTQPVNAKAKARVTTPLIRSAKRDVRPTFSFSLAAIRAQQLSLHPLQRIPVQTLALLAKSIPRTEYPHRLMPRGEGVCYDIDLALFTDRFVQDMDGRVGRYRKAKADAKVAAARKRRAEMILKRLQAKQNHTKAILAEAEAIRKPPAPPAGPPPPHILREARLREKEERKTKEKEALEAIDALEQAPFGGREGLSAENGKAMVVYNPPHWPRRRRATITDASRLHHRLTKLPVALRQQLHARRRLSLPSMPTGILQLCPVLPDMLFRESGMSVPPGVLQEGIE